ncbi:hypothetical protein Q0601_13670 [Paracoccus onubensis]|nr:hypothetical protein [Paracoccus onubensis]MDP0928230.1 hypothetical protein [Paracoccus onubensis]
MNNQVAVVIVALIVGTLVLDQVWLEQNLLVKAGKVLDDTIGRLAFWR